MQSLRRHRHLASPLAVWLLSWFLLMSASAYLAPPQVADAAAHSGHQLQQAEGHEDCDDGHALAEEGASPHHGVHCPMCLHAAAPPADVVADLASAPPPGCLQPPRHAAPPATFTACPPPARGPPALS